MSETLSSRNQESEPALSVILVTPGRSDIVRKTINALLAQTILDRIELVLVCASKKVLGNRVEATAFGAFQLVEFGEVRTLASARLAGIRAATAPLVALGEDHAQPDPGWAEALVKRHAEPGVAAAGSVFLNANPGMFSWTSLIMDYGRWIEPAVGGRSEDLPGHNTAWKRHLLLEYGDDLERLLCAPTIMHWDFGSRGYTLYLEPAAKVRHVNVTRWFSFILDHFHGARIFAGVRAHGWAWNRRLVYTAATPVFLIRKMREWRTHLGRIGLERELLPAAWPLLVMSAIVSSLGELLGYASGIGNAERHVLKYDAERVDHVRIEERALLTAANGPG